MKQFVKILNHDKAAFLYLEKKLPKKINNAKLKEGIVVGPQIRDLMHDNEFEATMDESE